MPAVLRRPLAALTAFATAVAIVAFAPFAGSPAAAATDAPVIVTQPVSATVESGQEAAFLVAVETPDEVTYQWERSADGEAWTPVDGASAAELRFVVAETDDAASFRAIATNDAGSTTSDAAVLTVTAAPEAPEAPEMVPVTGAQLQWAYSGYAQAGVFGAWRQWTTGTGVSLASVDGQSVTGLPADAGRDFTAVRFDGGVGELDAETGAGTITWPGAGSWKLNAYPAMYGAPDETLSEPILTIAADGTGTLSFAAYLPAHNDVMYGTGMQPAVGPERKVLATFSSVTVEDGVFTVVPDFAGREYTPAEGQGAWNSCDGAGGSWPAEWINFLPTSVRAHYYTTSCVGLNTTKPPFAFTVNTVETAPVIVVQPSAAQTTLAASSYLGLEVVATGNPISYQWQRSIGGGEWTDVAGETDAAYAAEAAVGDDGASFRVVVGTGPSAVTSAAVGPFTITTAPITVTTAPGDYEVGLGGTMSFVGTATGAPRPTATWERSTDGGSTWGPVNEGDFIDQSTPGTTTSRSTVLILATDASDTAQYRVTWSNGLETLVSAVVAGTVLNQVPEVRSAPTNAVTIAGIAGRFTASIAGEPRPAFQWEISTDEGATWAAWTEGPSATTALLSVATSGVELDGAQFRLRATAPAGEVVTDPVTLTVLPRTGERNVTATILAGDPGVTTTRVSVVGEGFEALQGTSGTALRVGFAPKSVWEDGSFTTTSNLIASATVSASSLTTNSGAFSAAALSITAERIQPDVEYGVVVFAAATGNRAYDTWIPLGVLLEPQPEIISTTASFETGWNASSQGASFSGACAYFSAGLGDGTSASYGVSDGDLILIKRGLGGQAIEVTAENRCAPIDGADGKQRLLFQDGVATRQVDGTVTIDWTGAFTVNAYGGAVPWSVADPTLTVRTDGTATLTGSLYGYASSMENPAIKVPLEPKLDQVVMEFTNASIDGDTISVTPVYQGVDYYPLTGDGTRSTVSAIPANVKASNPAWGSWPQDFVDYQYETGLSSYWHTSGGTADPQKPPMPVTIKLVAAPLEFADFASLAITTQPVNTDVIAGDPAVFTVVAETGSEDELTYQWQTRVGTAGPWTDVDGATGPTLTLGDLPSADGPYLGYVRVFVSDGVQRVESTSVRLRSQPGVAPAFTLQPTAHVGFEGSTARLQVRASGFPDPTFQWQISRDAGATWEDYAAPTTTLTLTGLSTDLDGAWFRTVVDNGVGEPLITSVATMTVLTASTPTIAVHPGEPARFAYPVDTSVNGRVYVVGGGLPSVLPAWINVGIVTAETWAARGDGFARADMIVSARVQTASNVEQGTFGPTFVSIPAGRLDPARDYVAVLISENAGDRSLDVAVPIELVEPPIEVTGAQLEWAYSGYAQAGVFGPWRQWTSGTGVSLATLDGQAVTGLSADAGRDFTAVRFDGGVGQLDAETGAGTITWPGAGSWLINAYPAMLGAPDETLSSPVLTIAADGTGTLSFAAYLPEHNDVMYGTGMQPAVGPERKVLATFSSVTVADGVITVVPDFAGRAYTPATGQSPWNACQGVGGSWPAEWIDFLPTSVRPHYYTTSCVGLNTTKPPLAFTVNTVAALPVIAEQPAATQTTLAASSALGLTVAATGNPISYQWQRSVSGGAWVDVAGETGSAYLAEAAPGDDGASFRVVVGSGDAAVISDVVGPFTITTAPIVVTVQPSDSINGVGGGISFVGIATGSPRPIATWERSTDGGTTWGPVNPGDYIDRSTPGTTTSDTTVLIAVADESDNAHYRVTWSNGLETIVSDVVTGSVLNEVPRVNTEARDVYAIEGISTFVSARFDGLPTPTVQWEFSTDDGATWSNWTATSSTDNSVTFTPGLELDGAQFRLVATAPAGTTTTRAATLHVAARTTGERTLEAVDAWGLLGSETSRVTVRGQGFEVPSTGTNPALRVGVVTKAAWEDGSYAVAANFVASSTAPRAALVTNGGAFVANISVPAARILPDTEYVVVVISGDAADRSYDAMVPLIELPDPIEITGAQLQWTYSGYAQVGVFGPWRQWTNGTGVSVVTVDGQVGSGLPADAGKTFTGARFDGGTGELDPVTGAGTISWPHTGAWVINAYPASLGAPDETLSAPILTIAADGSGTLSFEAVLPAHADYMAGGVWVDQVGPQRTVVATFSSVTIDDDGKITVVPDFAGRAYTPAEGLSPWQACDGVGGSWPSAWIDFVSTSVRAHYYTTSCSGLNLLKGPHPITVTSEPIALEITKQQVDVAANASRPVTLAVAANGNPMPVVTWQQLVAGEWTTVTGLTGLTVTFDAQVSHSGTWRPVFTVGEVVVAGEEFALTVNTAAPSFLQQPSTNYAEYGVGESIQINSAVTGFPTPDVVWERSSDGGETWTTVTEGTAVSLSGDALSTSLLLTASTTEHGALYRQTAANGVGENLVGVIGPLVVRNEPIVITTQPRSYLVPATPLSGAAAQTLSVEATGFPIRSNAYQWQVLDDATGEWSNIGSAIPSYTAQFSRGTASYRVIVGSGASAVTSDVARVVVIPGQAGRVVSVAAQTVNAGATVTFAPTLNPAGTPAPTVQWQRSGDGGTTWTNVEGATSATLSFVATEADHLARYRIVVDNGVPSSAVADVTEIAQLPGGTAVASSPAILTVLFDKAPIITTQPKDLASFVGQSSAFTAAFDVYPAATYRWSTSADDGATWQEVAGAAGEATTFTIASPTAEQDGLLVRVTATNTMGTTTSSTARLTVVTPVGARDLQLVPNAPIVASQPTTITVLGTGYTWDTSIPAQNRILRVSVGTATQWQPGQTAPPATDWIATTAVSAASLSTGKFRATLTIPAGALQPGQSYGVATASNTVTARHYDGWTALTLAVAPTASVAASAELVTAGSDVVLTATATGTPAPALQWQRTVGGDFVDLAGETAGTLALDGVAQSAQYRVVATNAAGSVTSNAVAVTVGTAASVTQHPTSVIAPIEPASGAPVATFTVATAGSPTPAIQWQRFVGGDWVAIGGATSATLSLGYASADAGTQVRAVATNALGTATSEVATLTLGDRPTVAALAPTVAVDQGEDLVIEADVTGTSAVLRWELRAPGAATWTAVDGAGTATLTVPAAEVRHGQQYRLTVDSPIPAEPGGAAALVISVAVQVQLAAPAGVAPDVSDDELTEGTEVPLGSFDGTTAVVHVGAAYAGLHVGGWLHSDPIALGWLLVAADGTVTVTIPAGVPAGAHRIVIVDASGALIGWVSVTVGGGLALELQATGAELPTPLIAGALLLLVLGAAGVGFARVRARRG